MTNSKNNGSHKDQHNSGSSRQDKNSSQDKKQTQRHASGKASSTGSDDMDDTDANQVNDDPEGTKKKIPQMKK